MTSFLLSFRHVERGHARESAVGSLAGDASTKQQQAKAVRRVKVVSAALPTPSHAHRGTLAAVSSVNLYSFSRYQWDRLSDERI